MRVYKAIYSILSNDSGVTDLVNNRIYPVNADIDSRTPYIVMQVKGSTFDYVKDETSKINTIDLDVSIVAPTISEIESVWDATRSALEKFTGTKEGVTIDQITRDSDEDVYDDDSRVIVMDSSWNVRVKN